MLTKSPDQDRFTPFCLGTHGLSAGVLTLPNGRGCTTEVEEMLLRSTSTASEYENFASTPVPTSLALTSRGDRRNDRSDRLRPSFSAVSTHPPNRWLDLVASGQVVPTALEGNLVDEAPDDYGIDASAQLAAMRDDER